MVSPEELGKAGFRLCGGGSRMVVVTLVSWWGQDKAGNLLVLGKNQG